MIILTKMVNKFLPERRIEITFSGEDMEQMRRGGRL
jgi:hypothetical protein